MIRHRWIRLLAMLTFCMLGVSGVCARGLPDDVMPVSEVRPGMKGVAYSVVHGFKLEKYDVEILGIEHGGLPGTPMILARVEGPGIEQHGIVAGMSGSPVYIDGKIVGAVAYGFQFAYRPVAGITPIESMLPMLDVVDADAGGSSGGSPDQPQAASTYGWDWEPAWKAYASCEPEDNATGASQFKATSPEGIRALGAEPLQMVPLRAPFYVSGASPGIADSLKHFFAARGLNLMPLGSSAGSNETPSEPAPPMIAGSALAIPIMTGDLSVAAIGTATYRQGDKILAFGHPAFSRGPMNAPMSQAYMIAYMQSYALSFKLGESREIVGAIRQDTQFGVAGTFGEAPPRIGVKVNITGDSAKLRRHFEYNIWEDHDFAPMFSMIALTESLGASASSAAETVGDCTYRIHLRDGREIVKSNRASARQGLGEPFGFPLMQDLYLLMNNPFQQADIESVDIDINVRPGFKRDQLLSVQPRYDRLQVDDPLVIQTRWRPYRGADYEKPIMIDLPADLKPGNYVVHLVDSNGAKRIDMTHNRGKYRPRDFNQTFSLIQEIDYPQNRLTAYLYEPEVGISLQGRNVEGIPGSIEGVLALTATDDLADGVIGREIQSSQFEFDAPVTGRATFTIEVVSNLPR